MNRSRQHCGVSALVAAVTFCLAGFDAAVAAGESPALAYRLHCNGCHMEDGSGAKAGRIPPIPGIAGHFLKHEKGRLYLVSVPGVVNSGLPDGETAQVLNYILEVFGANEAPVNWQRFTGDEVRRLRTIKVDDITALRNEIATDLAKQGIDLQY